MSRAIFTVVVFWLLLLNGLVRAEERSFDSHGVKLYYTVEGDGEPVVLIHGFAANGQMNWGLPGISKDLAQRYQVITLDNRGHGKSDKPHDPQSYGLEMVEDVVRLLDHLHIAKAHVVGYSMGGLITHKLATCHPDRLLSVTIGGIGWMREDDTESKAIIEQLTRSLDEGKGILPLLVRLKATGKPPSLDQELQLTNNAIMAMNDAKALAAAVRGFPSFAVPEAAMLANKVPMLVLIGSLDPTKTGVDRMKEKIPNLNVVEIPGTDHVTTLSEPKFIEAMKEFFTKTKQQ